MGANVEVTTAASATEGSGTVSFDNHYNDTSRMGMTRRHKGYFKSRKLTEADLDGRTKFHKSAYGKRAMRMQRISFYVFASLGIFASAAVIVTTWLKRDTNRYCLVMNEQFEGNDLNTSRWRREVSMGGYGNGLFDWTTDSVNNSFVQDGRLYIVPTLTSDSIGVGAVTNGYSVNLTATGTCTGTSTAWNSTGCKDGTGFMFADNKICTSLTNITDCFANSNSTIGTIIRPVQSARLISNFSIDGAIKFGRVEVKAKLPTGDWLWPAIWMLPRYSVYGPWPTSGEIDIVESKGNKPTSRKDEASNSVRSTLHWGPSPGAGSDFYAKTTKNIMMARNWFNKADNVFGLEWTPKGINTWKGSRARGILSVGFGQGFWALGGLTKLLSTGVTNPWLSSQTPAIAPFDQEFYMVLNVAVGGTNGFFGDSEAKPWSNGGANPALDFWNARSAWYPTWPADPKERGMSIEYIKMWRIAEPGEVCQA